MNKSLRILIIVSIVFNLIMFIYFRLSFERKLLIKVDDTLNIASSNFVALSSYALDYARNIIISNNLNNSSISVTNSNDYSLNSITNDPFFVKRSEFPYHYFEMQGVPFAKHGLITLSVSSPFPHGGFITAIYPECIIVNNHYLFENSQVNKNHTPVSSPISPVSSSIQNLKNLQTTQKNE